MQLSLVERWILSNQFRILEGLYPEEAKSFAEDRVALEQGYELHYEWLCEYLARDDQVMTVEECGEVVDILAMFSALKHSYEALEDKPDGVEGQLTFLGFDGNHESKQMAYTRYYCSPDGGRFQDIDRGDGFNSHWPMLDRYRRMLVEREQTEAKASLTKDDIRRILAAGE